MYEDNTRSTSGLAPHAATAHGTATRAAHDTANRATHDTGNRPAHDTANRAAHDSANSTDPKFVRESFTMRKMLPWQIVALAIAAAIVVGMVVFYI